MKKGLIPGKAGAPLAQESVFGWTLTEAILVSSSIMSPKAAASFFSAEKKQETLPSIPTRITKSLVMSDTARQFASLGFIALILILAKILYQNSCLDKSIWDTPYPTS